MKNILIYLKNQLKLAIKISSCDINPIDDIELDFYSKELKSIIRSILRKEPELRPSAKQILSDAVFSTKSQ